NKYYDVYSSSSNTTNDMKIFSDLRLFGLIAIFTMLHTACKTQKTNHNTDTDHEFKILTYNIHHANPPSKPEAIDIEAICKVIQQSDADVVALQEVDIQTDRSGKIDQAKLIAEKLGMSYHFFKAIEDRKSTRLNSSHVKIS